MRQAVFATTATTSAQNGTQSAAPLPSGLPWPCRAGILLAALALLIAATMPAHLVRAAEPPGGLTTDWDTAETEHFRFFVQRNEQTTASAFRDAFGPFAETAYEELSLLFRTTADRKISVYVYSDSSAYEAAVAATGRNELAGIFAHADPQNLDIAIPLSRFTAASELEAENQLRHAISHILTGVASNFRIPRGFDEGIAQYVERPNTPKLARLAAIVQAANQRSELPSWSNLNRDHPIDGDDLIAAQAYAVVAYLIQHHGLPEFQRFLVELRTAENWREALRTAYYPTDANSLEKMWRERVTRWVTSDWRWNLVAGFDLEPAKQLLARGSYRAAQDALQLSEQLFRALDDPRRRDEVEMLQAQCAIGIQAEELMSDTQQALERHSYDRAHVNLAKAKDQYALLPPEQRPDDLIAAYEQLIADGMRAEQRLEEALARAHNWGDYPVARAAALEAGSLFARLGDEERRAQAQSVLSDLDTRQRRLVLMLGALAVLTMAW
ncbi:MAG: hypothetical protein C4346_13750, partial [Chloroflexota bacterium]